MYKRKEVKKLTGDEKFENSGDKSFTVGDFWQYGFSNLNSNVLRGVLAEFLVENALKDKTKIDVRNPWDDYDVLSPDKKKIEVKCSSYLQDWDQKELSRIVWSGLKAKEIYSVVSEKKQIENVADYKADIYVFALLKTKDTKELDILDMDQWGFYVLSKKDVKRISKNSSSLSLKTLEKTNPEQIHFKDLTESINNCLMLV